MSSSKNKKKLKVIEQKRKGKESLLANIESSRVTKQDGSALEQTMREGIAACVLQHDIDKKNLAHNSQLFKNIASAFGDNFEGPITNIKRSTIQVTAPVVLRENTAEKVAANSKPYVWPSMLLSL